MKDIQDFIYVEDTDVVDNMFKALNVLNLELMLIYTKKRENVMIMICLQPERAPPALRDFSVYSVTGSAAGSSSALACATAERSKMKNWGLLSWTSVQLDPKSLLREWKVICLLFDKPTLRRKHHTAVFFLTASFFRGVFYGFCKVRSEK